MTALRQEQIIHELREQMPFLTANYGVSRIGLFGSFAREQARDDSDVDLVVEFQRPIGLRFIELADYLEALLGRKVDVLTPAGVAGIRVKRVAEDINASIVYV